MAFNTTPTHGRLGALWRLRPNGFVGQGLSDVTWGTGWDGANSAYYEVRIDGTGTPDTFEWREDGGAWTTDVNITGAAQTLSDSFTITFAATTGHTLNDLWAIGHLKDEPTTEASAVAQITAAARRILNRNAPPTFTDDGGETVNVIEYTNGKATFTGNVGNVDVDGDNGYIPSVALEKVGYLIDWSMNVNLDMADASRTGQKWKESLPGQASFSGSANAYFIGVDSFWESFEDGVDTTADYFLLKLFTKDTDQDQTGDHFAVWVTLSGFSTSAPLNDVVKESITFQGDGVPTLIEDS